MVKGAIALRTGFKERVDRSNYHTHMAPDAVYFMSSLDDRSNELRLQCQKNLRNFRGQRLADLHMDVQIFGSIISKSLRHVYEGES